MADILRRVHAEDKTAGERQDDASVSSGSQSGEAGGPVDVSGLSEADVAEYAKLLQRLELAVRLCSHGLELRTQLISISSKICIFLYTYKFRSNERIL